LYQLRASVLGSGFLDGVIYASLGLWAGVTWEITGAALVDPISVGIMVLSLFLLIAFDPNTSWLILGGALIGLMKGIIN
jgi:chromate transport protein ChrA